MNKRKYIILTVIAVLSFILITVGVTYSFFSYIGIGSTENTVESKSITFIYEEINKMGNGISITDALPISDSEGKSSSNYFDFKVTSTTASTLEIPYEITARKVDGSDNIGDAVKLYLTKVNGNSETQVALSTYDSLTNSTNTLASQYNDKTLYTSTIPVGSSNYVENYRLRMWLNNDTNDGRVLDYSPVYECSISQYTDETTCEANNGVWNPIESYNNQNKHFSVKINVYANGAQATQQSITSANSTTIDTITGGNQTAVQNTNTNSNYDYSMNVGNEVTEVDLNITPASDGAQVTVTPITEQQAASLKQVSTSTIVQLEEGDNYFRVDVTSANRQHTETYVVKVNRAGIAGPLATKILTDNSETKDIIIPETELKKALENSQYQEGLYKALDIDGTNYSYYYRGNVNNNYLKIGDDVWRIVRINGDGTIRIISQNTISYNSKNNFKFKYNSARNDIVDYMYYSNGTDEGTDYDAQTILNRWYSDNIENNNNYKDIVTTGTYCQALKQLGRISSGDSMEAESGTLEYNGYTLVCPQNDGNLDSILNNRKVGLITYEEIRMASGSGNTITYFNINKKFYTMSPAGSTDAVNSSHTVYVWGIYNTYLSSTGISSSYGLRPVINIKGDTLVTKEVINGNTYYVVEQ